VELGRQNEGPGFERCQPLPFLLRTRTMSAGFPVKTVAELRNPGVGNRAAVPVLLRWLPQVDYRPLKRDIIATLGAKWARPQSIKPLVEEYRRIKPSADNGNILWSLGDALESGRRIGA
jgi:hypothetical protein